MDIAELRNKLNNIAAELAEQDVQQEDIAIEQEQVEEVDAPVAEVEFAEEDNLEVEEEAVAEEEVEETVEVPVSALAELMQLAGYENYADKLQEYENEPEEEYSDTEDQLIGLSGGLNGPKKMYPAAAGGDNPMDQEPREIEESMGIAEVENKLYRSYQAFLEENDMAMPAIKKYPPGTKIDPKTMLPMPSKDGPKAETLPALVPPGTKIDPKLGRIQVPKGGPKIKNLPFKVD